MDASLIIQKLETAFSYISQKDAIATDKIKIGVSLRQQESGETQIYIDLFTDKQDKLNAIENTKIRSIDISTEILGLKRTKSELSLMTPMGKAFYDLHNSTQKVESFLAMGIFNKCQKLNYDVFKTIFYISKFHDKFIGRLIEDDKKITEITIEDIFSIEGMLG